MAFCTECGFRLPDDALFCPACGATVRDYAEPSDGRGESSGGAGASAGGEKPQGQGPCGCAHPGTRRTGGGRVAAIVVAIVVILFATAGYLLEKTVSGGRYEGYWESTAVEVNGEEKDSYFGRNIDGLFGLQLNEDGTASMSSAFEKRLFEGRWVKNGDTVTVSGGGENYTLSKKDGRIYLYNRGLYIIYDKKPGGSISRPSIPRGSLADGGASAAPSSDAPGSLDGGSYDVTITGAEAFRSEEGADELRVYFTFKNCSEYSLSAIDALNFVARQDGKSLRIDNPADDTETGRLLYASVRPGVTVQCSCCFDFAPKGGDVSVVIRGWFDTDAGTDVSQTFKPGSLPGAPQPMTITPVPEPKWTAALPGEGKLDDYEVSVTGAELTTDANGAAAVRVRYRFKNDGDRAVSMEDSVFVCTYQDGVSLDETQPSQETDGDRLYSELVKPGASAETSRVFRLRNDSSQIEAEVESNDSYDAVGQTYSAKK